jgi:AraC-like DNA-binding protein
MIATSYAIAFESNITASSNVGAWHARARLYIEQHLRTPDLTPCSIASKLKLSPRYLRMIFASGNETVSAYILRRRLEECARQIEDPRWSDHSITEIAFSWGFNSAPHFTRSFRDRYGIAPRRYRDRHGFKKRRRPLLSSPTASAPPQESPLPGPTQPASRGSF